jgi:hypothetical protein
MITFEKLVENAQDHLKEAADISPRYKPEVQQRLELQSALVNAILALAMATNEKGT